MPPVRFVERLQRIDAGALKLRPDQVLDQILAKTLEPFGKNHTAIAMVEIRQFIFAIPLDRRRAFAGNQLANALIVRVDKFKLLQVGKALIYLVELSGHFSASDHKESTLCSRTGNPF